MLKRPAIIDYLDSQRAIIRAAVIRGAPRRDIRDVCLSISQCHILPAERDQVLPYLIVFRHHLAPGIERFTAAVVNRSGRTVNQLVSALNVVHEYFRRRRAQWRVKFGHVFLLQNGIRPNEGLCEKS